MHRRRGRLPGEECIAVDTVLPKGFLTADLSHAPKRRPDSLRIVRPLETTTAPAMGRSVGAKSYILPNFRQFSGKYWPSRAQYQSPLDS